jgi:Dehydrogenases with different specificities (related to short-chain alcohol dehydrogenases)
MEYGLGSIKGKNVLITGGSGAIGQAIADGFEHCGANVCLWGHREIEGIREKFQIYQIVELADVQDISDKFNILLNEVGVIDVLVNCAGFTSGEASEKYPLELWNRTIAINLTAPFILSQLVSKSIIDSHIGNGSIINITSIGAEQGFPGNPAYGASKGGLKQLTKAMACDLAQYGIRVNSVGPGYTQTKMTAESWADDKMREERTQRTMMNHWAAPDDIVGTVLFLASDMSAYITGQDIYVDGGWTAKGL